MNQGNLRKKEERLKAYLGRLDTLLVAFSGGVDSTYLLAVAQAVLGDKLLAVTAASPVHPRRETEQAISLAKKLAVEHMIVQSKDMRNPDFLANTEDRCYFCKKNIIEDLQIIAREKKIQSIAHGANSDDLGDFRPGFRAVREMGVLSPLIEAGLSKSEIRVLSKRLNLETWNKPAMACLATRVPYHTPLTQPALKMVERAEDAILDLGFETCRVRHHGAVARIELTPQEMERILDPKIRQVVVSTLREIGFIHIAVDLEGYEQGRMNRSK